MVELSNDLDDDLLFNFVPIENLLRDDENKRYIAKDAYFRLLHVNTKTWISFQEDSLEKPLEVDKDMKLGGSRRTTLSSTAREMDIFKARKADFEEIWETSFLMSATPILLELADHLTPVVFSFNIECDQNRRIN